MAIIRWDPFRELESLKDSIDRFFEEDLRPLHFTGMKRFTTPSVNIYEEDKKLILEAEIPGVKEDDVNVEIRDEDVRISAEHKEEKEEKKRNYYQKEVRSGFFFRTIPLPASVNKDKAEASFENGILKIVMSKKELPAPKVLKLKPKAKK